MLVGFSPLNLSRALRGPLFMSLTIRRFKYGPLSKDILLNQKPQFTKNIVFVADDCGIVHINNRPYPTTPQLVW